MRELRNDIAIRDKRIIELEQENTFLRREMRGVTHRGENSTEDKINLAMDRRLRWLSVYIDRMLIPSLAQIHTLIILAVLYLAFGGKLP